MSKDEKMKKKGFNDGKPFHGSENVKGGKLTAKTTTDYLVPRCPECGEDVHVEIYDCEKILDIPANRKTEQGTDVNREFAYRFNFECPICGLDDAFKIGSP